MSEDTQRERERLEKLAQEWLRKWDGILLAGRETDGVAALADLLERVERKATQRERKRCEGIVQDERCPDPMESWEEGCQDTCDAILRRIKGGD